MRFLKVAAALAFGAMLTGAPVAMASDADFFKGKTLRIIVGYGPGGGYDAYARMLAPLIGERLGASVVVENQPGAGGITALNRVYAAKGDAMTMMIVNGAAAGMAQLVEQSGVRYDLAQMGQLGTVARSPWVWLVHKDSPIHTVADALKSDREISWAASGPIDGLSGGAWVTCEALKLKCQVVIGYKGSRDAGRAVMQGEMDAIYVSDTSAYAYVRTGDVRAVAVVNRNRSRFFKDTPTIFEQTEVSSEGQDLIAFNSAVEDLGRILVSPPGVEPAHLKVLQDAVQSVLNDEAVQAKGAKMQRYIEPASPEETLKNVRTVVDVTPERRDYLRKVMRLDAR